MESCRNSSNTRSISNATEFFFFSYYNSRLFFFFFLNCYQMVVERWFCVLTYNALGLVKLVCWMWCYLQVLPLDGSNNSLISKGNLRKFSLYCETFLACFDYVIIYSNSWKWKCYPQKKYQNSIFFFYVLLYEEVEATRIEVLTVASFSSWPVWLKHLINHEKWCSCYIWSWLTSPLKH